MPGTVLLFRVGGIPIRLHFSFLLLVGFLVVMPVADQADQADYLGGSLVVGSLFVSVLLHELGHAVVASRFGVKTLEIVMYVIGGVARMEKQPSLRQEFWIAIAGPMVNFVIGAGLWYGRGLLGGNPLVEEVAVGNVGMGLFNLLPAFPLDGGRILRSLLSFFYDDLKSTQHAVRIGRIVAVGMVLYGVNYEHWVLVIIAFFVLANAQQQYAAQKEQVLIEGATVREAMVTKFLMLPHGATIREAAEELLNTSQQDFPVAHGEQVIGLLSRDAIVRTLAEEGPEAYVAGAMRRDFLRVQAGDSLKGTMAGLSANGFCAFVFEEERMVGMLTQENLREFVMLRNFGVGRRMSS